MISLAKGETIDILLIEDEAYDVRRIRNTLKPFADRIKIAAVVSDGPSALAMLQDQPGRYDVVIMDFQISGGLFGEALIRKIKAIDETLQIIVVTKMTINVTDFEFANQLLDAGAMWYCTKYPGDIEEYIYQPTDFILSIFNAYEKRKLLREQHNSNKRLSRNIEQILARKQLIGNSPAMQRVREQIERFADTTATVLIHGPSGTGKELVATHLHYRSARKLETFLPVNCGSLPDHLIESELFGFERGSFTGASSKKKGLFEIADQGTIFLDEIAELPLSAQSKLLRVLQDGEIDKIGRTGSIRVDVRVIAATNKKLEKEVEAGRFREDLFYRLNVVSIETPPLTRRREDIPIFIEHFVALCSADMNREPPRFQPQALALLQEQPWPGNVRELQNVIQRLILAGGRKLLKMMCALLWGYTLSGKPQRQPASCLLFRAMRFYPGVKWNSTCRRSTSSLCASVWLPMRKLHGCLEWRRPIITACAKSWG